MARYVGGTRIIFWELLAGCSAALAWMGTYLATHLGQRPPVGVFVAAAGCLGVGAAFRKEPRNVEKALWALAIAGLTVGEIRTIYENDKEQQRQNAESRKEQNDRFNDIARDVNKTIAESHELIGRSDLLISQNREVMLNVTGGESYPALVPMAFEYERDINDIMLAIENRGGNQLTGVSITIAPVGIWLKFTKPALQQSFENRINVGTLHAGERFILAQRIDPTRLSELDEEDGSGKAYRAFVNMNAQNFSTTEYLDFRRATDGHWQFKYKIYRYRTDVNRSPRPETFLERVEWSDGPNNLHIFHADTQYDPVTHRRIR